MKCIVNAAFPVHVKVYCLWSKCKSHLVELRDHERCHDVTTNTDLPNVTQWCQFG